jgi:hypothetical protein
LVGEERRTALPVGKDDSIVAENVAVTERRGDKPTKVLTRLGARTVADFKEQAPVNTLDIVPAGKPGQFKVFIRARRSPRPRPS